MRLNPEDKSTWPNYGDKVLCKTFKGEMLVLEFCNKDWPCFETSFSCLRCDAVFSWDLDEIESWGYIHD